ncbi:MAG TPA: hypothetical protein VMF66_20720 [Candidatus Acidoferrum sp.]|nr:hypothetical protein [Candidatus Acidoferrum sp.]
MNRSPRRNFPPVFALMLLVGALVVAIVAAPGFAAQQQTQSPGGNPFPQTFPDRPNFGPQPLPQPSLGENNPGPLLRANQNEMQKDIDQLYAMVQQLKDQSDKTNSTQVLSLGLVNKAKNIEDLAKKIGNLAKGH